MRRTTVSRLAFESARRLTIHSSPRRRVVGAFCKCRSCTFWTPSAIDACETKRATKLAEKVPRNHTKKVKEVESSSDGPRDHRYVKKLDDWLGIKPKVPTAWQVRSVGARRPAFGPPRPSWLRLAT